MQSVAKVMVMLVVLSVAQTSWARRDRREGFNFGTTLKVVDTDDRRYAVGDASSDSRSERSTQSFTPYVGYSFSGVFNLGLAATMQQTSDKSVSASLDGQNEVMREVDASMKAGNLFVRLLFGKVMFLEVGAGLYSESVQVKNETRIMQADGSYEGRREDFKTESMGSGYHGGIGVEIEMGGGFYFSSSYMTRVYHLKEVKGGDLGAKTGFQQNRELNFGLAYYY